MACPDCGGNTKRVRVIDDDAPFWFSECSGCGWDDYDIRCREANEPASDGFDGEPAELINDEPYEGGGYY